ncbi:MAG: DUF4197 domain-containing protein [Akkermansiaceae bacterium]|nr:DUF4197 domain-containing protein [Verrucomicrobiales bacterium]
MKTKLFAFITALALSATLTTVHAGFLDRLGFGKGTNAAAGSAALSTLSNDQMISGLKEALGKGLQRSVAQLGQPGGFLTNAQVRIPMPEKLAAVEKTLRSLKQDKLADDFVVTMNHAAEQAVPEAAAVFSDAVKQMSIADAKAILTGPNDAATQFFRRTTQSNLFARFKPIVEKSTASTGVTSSYKSMMAKVSGGGAYGSMLGNYLGKDALDVDTYVTQKSMDGLFKLVAEEEKRIRENPAARTTDLLKQVFGAAAK